MWLFGQGEVDRGWEWREGGTEADRLVARSLAEQAKGLYSRMSEEARAGYLHLVETPYLPSDFDEDVLARLDGVEVAVPFGDIALQSGARGATWMRYGMSERPDQPDRPLQYIQRADGRYIMNCFACHGGNLYGASYPGAGNTLYALESLTEKVRLAKLQMGKTLTHMDIGSLAMPLGTTVGSSNAVMFGVALLNYRDAELRIYPTRLPSRLTNHDMDAPAWWHFKRKHHLYIDGFAEKGHRGLMQFMLVKENGPAEFRGWEEDFRKVYAYLMELEAPYYPLPIDEELASEGGRIFADHCADCHGVYGKDASYPERRIPLRDLGTDGVRLEALTAKNRTNYAASWFAHFGEQATELEVDGYVAPPLDGLWASAPYFHNGSVPTLWDVLHSEERPVVWRRSGLGLDAERMGLRVERCSEVPETGSSYDRRWYFDTRKFGKSAKGHDYPNVLNEEEKRALLEYLKTL